VDFVAASAAISLTVLPKVKHYPWSGKKICNCRLGTKSGRYPDEILPVGQDEIPAVGGDEIRPLVGRGRGEEQQQL
jgi:hypothetical protein